MNTNSKTVRPAVRRVVAGAAIAGAATLLSGHAAFAADKEKKENKNTVTKELAKPLKEASDALNAKKYADAIAKAKEADGNAKKSPYDQHIINEILGVAYARTSNFPEASKAFEAELNDGFLDEKEVPGRIKAVAQMNYQLKNYDKAI